MNIILLIASVIAGILICWVILIKFISHLSGWNTLRNTYETLDKSTEINYFGILGKIGKFYYNNILNIALSDEGLYLAVPPIFRFGHPALLIPWKAIKSTSDIQNNISCEIDGIQVKLSSKILNMFKSYLSNYS